MYLRFINIRESREHYRGIKGFAVSSHLPNDTERTKQIVIKTENDTMVKVLRSHLNFKKNSSVEI